MSTSLAQQLERLRVPQTTLLTRDKKRPSLLFDPKEAANLNRETVFQIGLDGLEELISKNPIFSQFESNLFHVTSKDFERSVQTAEVNRKLDGNIRRFLLLLSPYFLLNCSHKALEWLVNRFHIHEFNREDFLMLILPYHETNIFVRALQLLQFRDVNDKWYWLKSLQKPGVHLPKKTLYNRAASDVYFINFVSNFILLVQKEHQNPSILTVAFNFYCTTLVGALEHSREVSEAQIQQLLPALLKGLSSKVPDFCAAAYLIVGELLRKTQLQEKALRVLVRKITSFKVPSLKNEGVVLLVILYKSQEHFRTLTDKAIDNLVTKEWLPNVLSDLKGSGCDISAFFDVICREFLKSGMGKETEHRSYLLKVLNTIKLEDEFVENFLNAILDVFDPNADYSEETEEWISEIVSLIERSNPDSFDRKIKNLMKETGSSASKHRDGLKKIFKHSFMRGNYDIFEKLYHPQAQIRKEAMKYVIKNYEVIKNKEKDIVKSIFVDRLNDQDPEIVMQVLKVPILTEIIGHDVLKSALLNILSLCRENPTKWWVCTSITIRILCSSFKDCEFQTFLAVLPFLLPISESELKIARQIIGGVFGENYATLKELRKCVENSKNYEDFFGRVFNGIKFAEGVENFIEKLQIVGVDVVEKHKFLIFLLLANTLPKNSSIQTSYSVMEIYYKYLQDTKIIFNDEVNNSIIKYVMDSRKGKLNLQGFLHCIKTLIFKTEKPKSNLNCTDFSDVNNHFYPLTAAVLLKACGSAKNDNITIEAFDNFLTHCTNDVKSNIELPLHICIAENDHINDDVKLFCIKYVASLLKIEKSDLFANVRADPNNLLDFKSTTVPYLLSCLNDPNVNIRTSAFKIIKFLVANAKNKNGNYWLLLNGLSEHVKEILLDHEQMPLIIHNVLYNNNEKTSETLKKTTDHLVDIAAGVCGNPLYLSAQILIILSHVNNYDIIAKTSKLPIDFIVGNESVNCTKSCIIYYNILRLENTIAPHIDFDSNVWMFLRELFKNEMVLKYENTNTLVCVLNHINNEFFDSLKETVKEAFIDLILHAMVHTKSPEVVASANRFFKHIDLDVGLVLGFIKKMCEVRSPKIDESKLKRRISTIPTPDILDTLEWKKGVSVLEFIQDKKKIKNTTLLIPVLFDVLKRCLDFDEQTIVEYPKQLLLSSILHCCNKTDVKILPENAFKMDLVVQCIRISQNPQTHHHALLLLAYTADLIPDQVLHNIMSIFTFMGSSVLRQDDAYSFQIITKIIDTIIPILISNDAEWNIGKVLRVFVDAVLDVAEHRRLPLYRQLLNKIDPHKNLHLFLLLVFEAHVTHSNTKKQTIGTNRTLAGIENMPRRLDIAASLCREFKPDVIIQGCIDLIEYLITLPVEQNEKMDTDDKCITFDVAHHSAKQFRHYKYTIVTFIASYLASNEFVQQIALLSDDDLLHLEPQFKKLIIKILSYIHNTSKIAEKNRNTPQAQYWKVMLHHTYDILDSLNALLTPQMFLLVIRGLMVHSLPVIRRRAIELLNTKLQYNSDFFKECDETEMNALIPPLINIIKKIEEDEQSEQETIILTALLSLKLLVKLMAPKNPQKFVQILDFMTGIIKSNNAKDNVLASSVLCLAELCSNLRAHSISSLSKFMPALLKILKKQHHQNTPSLLLLSAVLAVQKIVDSLPLFISSYLEKLLFELSLITSKFCNDGDDNKTGPLIKKLADIKEKIGSSIPARVLIPAVEQAYENLIKKGLYGAIEPLMGILAENLSNLPPNDIQSNLPNLTSFFLNSLQFRSDTEITLDEINLVESHIITALTALILKLSESTFRPLYYKIYDWAIRSEEKTERVITFYNLSSGVAEKLKSLFVLFAGHFLNNAANLLDLCNTVKNDRLYFDEIDKNILLLENILKTLHSVFLYDTQRFINKERFEVLMQPLVDQLENTAGGPERLQQRKTILISCMVQFAIATADDSLWKQLNYQILLKLRHSESTVRLCALECFTEIAKKLGEDFLPLLPETIPFLAELLEDEDETVEKACQRSVQELEKVLGEPLQKYF